MNSVCLGRKKWAVASSKGKATSLRFIRWRNDADFTEVYTVEE